VPVIKPFGDTESKEVIILTGCPPTFSADAATVSVAVTVIVDGLPLLTESVLGTVIVASPAKGLGNNTELLIDIPLS